MAEITEETKVLLTLLRHKALVSKYLIQLARALEARALTHDLSKFGFDEFGGFVDVQRIARQHKLGSPEYKASISSEAVRLHLSRNSHHPEYYANGIRDMSLLDLIEMVIDWKAASETYGKTSFAEALPLQKERFRMTGEQYYLIQLIAEELIK